MSHVELRGITKRFGAFEAIKEINLKVEKGQFCALLGPSGCGKSTLLRLIAGLEAVSEGQIFINGHEVTYLAPAKRKIAMVFQSYALYPHMNVRKNISFSLDVAGVSKEDRRKRSDEVGSLLQLDKLMDRRPSQLSGGQRQRVAIGRALVRDPEVFLFDEPLSNLDALLRVQMRLELANLHEQLKTTMIYVTHDQIEAMTLADKIVVLDQGQISQIGTPLQLYNEPANKFVASFIGTPAMNFLPVSLQVKEGRVVGIDLSGAGKMDIETRSDLDSLPSGDFEMGIRPEHISIVDPDDGNAIFTGRVQMVERLGNSTLLYMKSSAGRFSSQVAGDFDAHVGDRVGVVFERKKAHLFAPNGLKF